VTFEFPKRDFGKQVVFFWFFFYNIYALAGWCNAMVTQIAIQMKE